MDKNGKILIVDDSKFNREILSEILNQYTVIEVKNGYEALEYMKADKNIALVLLDLVMPEMDGFEVLKYMNQNHLIDEIAVMIISINKDDQSIEKAYELGISGYITRPFSSAVVLKKVNNIISHYKRQKKLTTIINKQIYEKYKNNDMMIMILSHIVESRNGESGLHVLHIKKLTKLLLNILVKKTNQYSLTLDDMISIEVASSLHDIGKIAIPEEILNKPSSLTKEEMEVMKSHVIIGAKMLNSLPFYNDEPIVKYGYQICRWHHERYDGNGYPDGLKGEEIPIAAQVVSIVDAYDALTSKRVYKEAYSHEEALKMIQKGKCGVFNPLLIECLMDIESYIQNDLKINEFYEDNEYFEERTQEHLKDEGLNLSNLLYQDLYFEKSKYKFYSELSNNIQFEYSVVPPLLTLSKKDALLLNIEPKIIDPLSNEKVTKLFINNDFNVFIQQAIDLKKENVDSVRLVVDSGQILVKCSVLPEVSHKQMLQFVKDEFIDVESQYTNLLYDYAVIKDKVEGKEGQLVLCAAMEREFLKPYIDLFDEMGISLESIDIMTNSIIKLTESILKLTNLSYVLTVINGQDVIHYLFINGQYEIANRTRIFSDRGTVSFITELSNSLTKLMQFTKGAYKDAQLEKIYFAGLETYEEDMLMSTISSNLSIETSRFKPTNYTCSKDNNFPIHKYLFVGSLWRR